MIYDVYKYIDRNIPTLTFLLSKAFLAGTDITNKITSYFSPNRYISTHTVFQNTTQLREKINEIIHEFDFFQSCFE